MYGCPRNFSGFSTGGLCSALFLYRSRSGNYGEMTSRMVSIS
ncbi:MAG: hypothetical protein FIO02_07025 [Nitrosopumilales archaeon]|nr:hypothetical protein [Nitrosopumilales archaeon]